MKRTFTAVLAWLRFENFKRRTPMKRKGTSTTVAVLSSVVLLACLVPASQAANCSTATVAGSWGATLTGTLILPTGPVPVGAVLRASVDEEGNFTGTEARSVGGGYADETFTGKWTVNADCTGSVTASFFEDGQLARISVLAVVFDDNSKQFRMVQKSLTLPGGTQLPVVIIAEGKKQSGKGEEGQQL
jgi:hypothetical protein